MTSLSDDVTPLKQVVVDVMRWRHHRWEIEREVERRMQARSSCFAQVIAETEFPDIIGPDSGEPTEKKIF